MVGSLSFDFLFGLIDLKYRLQISNILIMVGSLSFDLLFGFTDLKYTLEIKDIWYISKTPLQYLSLSHTIYTLSMSKEILLILLFLWIWAVFANALKITLHENCTSSCGGVDIPYPFGVGDGCYKDKGFEIICKTTPFLLSNGMEVLELRDQVRIKIEATIKCYDSKSGEGRVNDRIVDIRQGPFTFSNTRNKLFAVGCDVFAYIIDSESEKYIAGCVSLCRKGNSDVLNGSCSGIGCCQTTIPRGVKAFIVRVDTINTQTRSWAANSEGCSYATVQDRPILNLLNVTSTIQMINSTIQMINSTESIVLDWVIGKQKCKEARRSADYACLAEYSHCIDSSNGPGYLCDCHKGFTGNPYLSGGCHDIDECKGPNQCRNDTKCVNMVGGYYCYCSYGKFGLFSDPSERQFCIPYDTKRIRVGIIFIGIGASAGVLALLAVGFWLYRVYNKRKDIRLKQKFYKRNGGLLLEQQVSSSRASIEKTKIFITEDLRKATDNFNEGRILGTGGSGTVYKGMLSDGRIVAIKKSKVVDESQIEQFINELVLLSHINHKSIVKLLGCCLETEVPMLVYEYISNGTLTYHLHDEEHKSSISWEDRLRITVEIAGALSYLHSSLSIPIFHRDIKSSNILLDENYKAKISDFGISRSVPYEKTHLTTLVQGTFGYLDPEYFHSSQFTDKSDVYSFGVVLAELLTGQKPISLARSEEEKNLVMHFVSSVKENRVFETVETRVLKEGSREELLAVAKLAKRCLKLVGKKRPTMKEVSTELEGLRKSEKQQEDFQEISYNLYDSSASFSLSSNEGEDSRLMVLETI